MEHNRHHIAEKRSPGFRVDGIANGHAMVTIEPTAGSKYQSPRANFIFPGFPGSRQGKANPGFFPRRLPRNFFTRLPGIFC
jgi:hypothetical protein